MNGASDGKYKLAKALTGVMAREGIAGVSVRSVAAEAGVSAGAVQYHFATRAEMIRYAMEWTSAQVEQRLSGVSRWGEVREWTRQILMELLPLDAERRREHAVWLAFVAHSGSDPALAELKRQTNLKLHGLYVRIVRARRGVSASDDERQADVDAVLLQSLLDGLSLHLADLGLTEARGEGPELLDRYLALAVDLPVAERE